jgi:Sec-independent protein secretion pathway component TatC
VDPIAGATTSRPVTTVLLRLGIVLTSVVVSTAIGFTFAVDVARGLSLALCRLTVDHCEAQIIDPTESRLGWFSFACLIAVPLALPFIIDQALRLFAPHQRQAGGRFVLIALIALPAFFLIGAISGALVLAPALHDLLPLVSSGFGLRRHPVHSVAIRASLWFGLAGVVPLLMILAARLRLIEWRRLPVLLPAVVAMAVGIAGWIMPRAATTAVVVVAVLLIAIFGLGILGARLATPTPPRMDERRGKTPAPPDNGSAAGRRTD